MRSHVIFTADCQLKQLEQREKKGKKDEPGNIYWTVKDNLGVSYLVYQAQKRLIPYLEKLLPEDSSNVSAPVRLEGYISEPQFRKFYCLLRIFTWDSTTETYEIYCDALKPGLYPENPDIFPETEGGETDE